MAVSSRRIRKEQVESTSGDLVIRQLQPEDAALYLDFFNGLDPATIRCRYGHMVARLTIDSAERIASLDPQWEPALAVLADEGSRIVAIGRFYADPERRSAEIAVAVDISMRRHGIGRMLIDSLIKLAAARGLEVLHAYVVTEDAPVLDLLDSFGFLIVPDGYDEEVKLSLRLR